MLINKQQMGSKQGDTFRLVCQTPGHLAIMQGATDVLSGDEIKRLVHVDAVIQQQGKQGGGAAFAVNPRNEGRLKVMQGSMEEIRAIAGAGAGAGAAAAAGHAPALGLIEALNDVRNVEKALDAVLLDEATINELLDFENAHFFQSIRSLNKAKHALARFIGGGQKPTVPDPKMHKRFNDMFRRSPTGEVTMSPRWREFFPNFRELEILYRDQFTVALMPAFIRLQKSVGATTGIE
jgi:hypothetical protein